MSVHCRIHVVFVVAALTGLFIAYPSVASETVTLEVAAGDLDRENTVVVEEMHYGGLMIRGHADWQEHKNFDYLTSEGKTKRDGNHTRPRWVDICGPVEGKMTGVTILDHPDNFRFPQPVRLHPSMPYFCFVPALLGSFTIEPGKSYVSRYRFCVHDDKPDRKLADRLWQDFGYPIKTRIVPRR